MEASAVQVGSVIRFGVFELDARSGELRRSGVLLNLQDQPLKVLECLLERPGELVTREALRQRLWPGDTFVDFEQGVNAAVKRLRETLADSAESPRFVETLPRRGYRFIAPVERDDRDRPGLGPSAPDHHASPMGKQAPPAIVKTQPAGARRWRHGLVAAGAIALVLLMTIAAWQRRAPAETPAAPLSLIALTTLTGSESGPTFSPDGRQVAFAWDGEQQDNSDIYVKLVGSSEVRRLTSDAAVDFAPQWSPDGKWIAYVRSESPTSNQIRLMSSLGGSERVLKFPLRPPATWSPDGRYLVAGRDSAAGGADQNNGIYLVPAEIGEPRPITRAVAPAIDGWPALSPGGRHLAYASCQDLMTPGNCNIQVLELDSRFAPLGSPRRVTPAPFWTIRGSHGREMERPSYLPPGGAGCSTCGESLPTARMSRFELKRREWMRPFRRRLPRLAVWPFQNQSMMRTSSVSTRKASRSRWRDRRSRIQTPSFHRTGAVSPSVRRDRGMRSRSGSRARMVRNRSD